MDERIDIAAELRKSDKQFKAFRLFASALIVVVFTIVVGAILHSCISGAKIDRAKRIYWEQRSMAISSNAFITSGHLISNDYEKYDTGVGSLEVWTDPAIDFDYIIFTPTNTPDKKKTVILRNRKKELYGN